MVLADLIANNRKELMGLWRTQARKLPAAEHLDTPTLTDMMPRVLDDLVAALQAGTVPSIPQAFLASPKSHALERLDVGFNVKEVIGEYGIMQELVLDLAEREEIRIAGTPVRIITRFFASAMADAVEVYMRRAAETLRGEHAGREGRGG